MSPTHSKRRGGNVDGEHIEALDVVRPVTNVGVIATHTTQAFAGVTVASSVALAGLHATRHAFFIVSALVLVYAHYHDEHFSALRFWGRRLLFVVVPYVIWTLVYYFVSVASLPGLDMTARPSPDTLANRAHQLGALLITGTGHLYFIVVLIQFYVLYPLVLYVLRRTHRWHVLLFVVSFIGQLVLDQLVHHHDLPAVFMGTSGNRQIVLYEFYLLGGGIVGAHLREIEAFLLRTWFLVAPICLIVCVGLELRVLRQLHEGVSIAATGDPFAPVFVFFNVAGFLLLYMLGMWWGRSGVPFVKSIFRSASDNSYGVYLVHAALLDTFGYFYLAPWIQRGGSRAWATVIGVALVYACGLIVSSIFSRLPFSMLTVSRARRPLIGGPAPVGRGTNGEHPRRETGTVSALAPLRS